MLTLFSFHTLEKLKSPEEKGSKYVRRSIVFFFFFLIRPRQEFHSLIGGAVAFYSNLLTGQVSVISAWKACVSPHHRKLACHLTEEQLFCFDFHKECQTNKKDLFS